MSALRIVLLRPRVPENLGAVARAMKNFGFDDWVLVAPEGSVADPAALRLAVHSEDVLAKARVVATLAEAVADCDWVVATTMRSVRGRRRLSPAELAREARERVTARTAIVFGDERIGVTNEELKQCHAMSSIGTDEAQPSLNLAQAVMLYAYEWSTAAPVERRVELPIAATDGELRMLEDVLERTLRRGRFLHRTDGGAMPLLVAPLKRCRLTKKEFDLWNAALHVLEGRFKAQPPPPTPPKNRKPRAR